MRALVTLWLVLQCVAHLAAASGGCSGWCEELSRAVERARTTGNAEERHQLFVVLREIADGRGVQSRHDEASRSNANASLDDVSDVEARAQAIILIGELGTTESKLYLSDIKRESFSPREVHIMWSTVELTLNKVKFDMIDDRHSKIIFLEDLLARRRSSGLFGSSRHWAWQWLCENGSLGSLPLVSETIKEYYGDARADGEIAFCKECMIRISSSSSQLQAFEDVLLGNVETNERLRLWAINSLVVMDSADADKVLRKFREWVAAMPMQSEDRLDLLPLVDRIRLERPALKFQGQLKLPPQ